MYLGCVQRDKYTKMRKKDKKTGKMLASGSKNLYLSNSKRKQSPNFKKIQSYNYETS